MNTKPEATTVIVTKPVGVCDRGEKAEPAWRGDAKDFKLNRQGRSG